MKSSRHGLRLFLAALLAAAPFAAAADAPLPRVELKAGAPSQPQDCIFTMWPNSSKCFSNLRAAGNTLLVIGHNLGAIKTADWIVDLGPEGGADGGRIIAEGTPEQIVTCPASCTGKFLRRVIGAAPVSFEQPRPST